MAVPKFQSLIVSKLDVQPQKDLGLQRSRLTREISVQGRRFSIPCLRHRIPGVSRRKQDECNESTPKVEIVTRTTLFSPLHPGKHMGSFENMREDNQHKRGSTHQLQKSPGGLVFRVRDRRTCQQQDAWHECQQRFQQHGIHILRRRRMDESRRPAGLSIQCVAYLCPFPTISRNARCSRVSSLSSG